ncbi:MAG: hypothetical protein HYV27_17300 [Candidatus Hydrogenedentes bacterium]|nr:hypothetical protein [Candidatus Hydrogenedentota bacterium]
MGERIGQRLPAPHDTAVSTGAAWFLAAGLGAAAAQFFAMLSILAASGQPYDTDTAHVLSHISKDFKDFIPWFGVVLRLSVYYPVKLMQLDFENIVPLRMIAVCISLSGMLYAVWLVRRHGLLEGLWLLVFAVFYGVNQTVHTFGTWAMIPYAMDVVSSTVLLHLLLLWEDTGKPFPRRLGVLIGAGLLALVLISVRILLPGAILIAVLALLFALGRGLSLRAAGRGAALGLAMGLPMLVCGLSMMAVYTHAEYLQPRDEIHHLYFPFSEYPKSLHGAVSFAVSRYAGYLAQAFAPSPFFPLHGQFPQLLPLVLALFHVGLIRSFFLYASHRFRLAVYLSLTLLALLTTGLTGLYAFGEPRYALFIHMPVLLMAVLGIADALSLFAWFFKKAGFPDFRAHPATLFVGRGLAGSACVPLLLGQAFMTLNTLQASHAYRESWRGGMQRVESAPRDTAVVYDQLVWYSGMYFRGLRGPDAQRASYAVHMNTPPEQGRFEEFLSRYGHFFSVTSAPFNAENYPESATLAIARGFKEVPRVALDRWYLGRRWHFSEWFSKGYNHLAAPDDFGHASWRRSGAVSVKTAANANTAALTLAPGASILQADAVPVAPGDRSTGEVWLWSDTPGKVILVVGSHDTADSENAFTVAHLDSTPQQFAVDAGYRAEHAAAALSLLNPGGAPIRFFARDARLARAGAQSGAGEGPVQPWRSVGASACEALAAGADEVRCLTGPGNWDGVVYGGDSDSEVSSLACAPDTAYEVRAQLKGVEGYEGVKLHIAVYDQDQNRLAAPSFALTADFEERVVSFRTSPSSHSLTVQVVKAKSPRRVVFAVKGPVLRAVP